MHRRSGATALPALPPAITLLTAVFLAAAFGSPTDQLKWPLGQVPSGQSNGPDSLDDIWQANFQAWGIDPQADSDADGCSNHAESLAGTDPFNPSDCFRLTEFHLTRTIGELSAPVRAGKRYRVLGSNLPGGPSAVWAVETLQLPAAGTDYVPSADQDNVLFRVASAGTPRFYKLEVADFDSNGDGLTDWAARHLGLDPMLLDNDGDGTPDATQIATELSTPDVVTVVAESAFAMEGTSENGRIKVRRSHSLLTATVLYQTTGNAQEGTDYAPLPGALNFDRGSREATIAIVPNADAHLEGGESVTVSLLSAKDSLATSLEIGGNGQATVIISDPETANGTGLLARYYDHANTTEAHGLNFGDTATYAYTRLGSSPNFTGTVVIPYTKSPQLQIGHVVRVTFTSGNLNNATYNHQDYTVTAVNAGTNFTVALPSSATLPSGDTGNCAFSIRSFPHPAALTRLDSTVDFEWMGGTPNGVPVTGLGSVPSPTTENYSTTFETYLHPASAGSYRFQLDADDRARVLLDLNDGNGLQEILEHGWDATPDIVGTFKVSASYTLAVPASPANRYRLRVEHVETTGDARCRLQWSRNGGNFANLPQGEQFTHTQTANYAFTRTNATTGTATITLNGHGLSNGNSVAIAFSSSNLFNPNTSDPAGYSGIFTVASATTNAFTVPITGTNLPSNVSVSLSTINCFVENRPNSSTTGVYNKVYLNTIFANSPGRVGVDSAVTSSNNGLWGSGTPDVSLIAADTFSVRWSGQVQPQFTEDYTFVVWADDACTLRINGETQELKAHTAANQGGSTYTYTAADGNLVINYANSVLKLNSFVVGEPVRIDPSGGNLTNANNSTYTYDGVTGDAVVNYSNLTNLTPGSLTVDEFVELDPTSGSLSPLGTLRYRITAVTPTTFTVNFGTGTYFSGSGNINISDVRNAVVTSVTPSSFTVNIGPGRYANGSSGNINIDIANKPLKDWVTFGGERFVRLPMIGGKRYDIQLDYWENGGFSRCHLYWYSASQPRQIIPASRLYPADADQAPASHLTTTDAVALAGGPVAIPVLASNGSSISVGELPPWLSYADGLLTGTLPPGSAGVYQILLTFTSAAGTSQSLINLTVTENGGSILREQWNSVFGSGVAAIPTGTAPASTTSLTTLQAPANIAENYGARLRGYLTAPVSGIYRFWLAANNAAELWIANDAEPVNAFRRASVHSGTAPEEWTSATEPNQKSSLLALEAGQKYYFEILHQAGTGPDHLAVAWAKPGDDTDAPSEIVPGYVLSEYVPPAPGSTPGTLYIATMLAQGGALTSGVGTATLRLSDDENTAIVGFNYSGLTGPMTDWHVHMDPYLTFPSSIIYDGTEPVHPNDGPQADGTHHWTIEAVGSVSKADIIELIKQGKAYINLHTALYPAGEIRGNFNLAAGSRTFSPPPAPPAWADDHATDPGASRFLTQATFGPSIGDLQALKAMPSYEAWIDDQFTKPASQQLPEVLRTEQSSAQGGAFDESLTFNAWWWNSIAGDDQLRQRIAFALSEILVVSAQGPLDNNAAALSFFYDQLTNHAFGNFRDILEVVTLTPTMGRYLDMLRNDKPDLAIGRIPNENYAREIKQLFSVGLFRMWPDGTLILNSHDAPIDTYSQLEIIGFSHVFTGWDYGYNGDFRASMGAPANWTRFMREVPSRHFTGPKRLLNNEVIPGLASLAGQPLDPYAPHNAAQFNDPTYQALPAQELDAAHDQLFQHPNVGPFICRQLIQRLVTSHPSRDYLYRVTQKFNDNGSGVRGDMKAVIKAILLDYEARSTGMLDKPAFGKQREPVLRVAAAARAFRTQPLSGTYTQNGTRAITVTTSTPHRLPTGNSNIFLDFTSGTPPPSIGTYAATYTGPSSFTVQALGWATGTYSIPANSNQCTVTMNNHWLQAGHKVFVDFTSGTANGEAGVDQTVYTLTAASAETGTNGTFTFSVATATTSLRSGSVMIPRFNPGSYTIANSGLPSPNDKRVTMDTTTNHELNVGDQVQLNIFGGNPQPVDLVATVDSIVDLNTWTFLVSSATTNWGTNQGFNSVYQFPLKSLPLTRSGNLGTRPSTYNMGSTDADIDQSPLNSPTVFNFFLPDFKHPGALASQGITTPEFQTTAETSVVRQSNFFYNGLFNPSGATNGLSSFKSGSNALVLDLTPWMGTAFTDGLGAGPQTSQAWTSNANIDTLIEHFNVLLTAGQLSPTAKSIIRSFVGRPITSISTGNPCTINLGTAHRFQTGDSIIISGVTGGTFSSSISATHTITVPPGSANTFTVPINCTSTAGLNLSNSNAGFLAYSSAAPTDPHKRDRLRAILHLILTSPDFAIQR